MPGDGAVMKHSLKRLAHALEPRGVFLDRCAVDIPHIGQRGRRVHHARRVRKTHRRLPDIAWEFELVPRRRTFGLATEAAEAPRNIGLKSDARLFPIVAHVNTGFDLFADHMRGCRLHLTGQLGGIDRLAGFLADQQVGQSFGTRQTADMTDQDAVGAHQHARFPASLDGGASCSRLLRASKRWTDTSIM